MVKRYNTGNPVPSGDPRDFNDNSLDIDTFVNGNEDCVETRIGRKILTLLGIDRKAREAIDGFEDLINDKIIAEGGMQVLNNWIKLDNAPLSSEFLMDNLGYITPEMFGAVGDGINDDSDSFIRMLDSYKESGSVIVLSSKTYVVGVIVNKLEGVSILSNNATLRRSDDYRESLYPMFIFGNDINIIGGLTVDCNNPLPTNTGAIRSSIEVVGSNNKWSSVRVINNKMQSLTDQQYGVVVYGDNFYCREFIGIDGGYSSIRLFINGEMDSFIIDSIKIASFNFKGFSIGRKSGSTGYIENINLGSVSIHGNPSDLHVASDGFLCDTGDDNTILSIGNLNIENINISGGESNCIKIENVLNLNINSMNLNVTSTYASGNAASISCVNVNINNIHYNNLKVRLRSLNTVINHIVFSGDTSTEPFRLESLLDSGSNIHLKGHQSLIINSFTSSNSHYLIGIDAKQDDATYDIYLGKFNAVTNYIFANYDNDSDGYRKFIRSSISIGIAQDEFLDKLHVTNNFQRQIKTNGRYYTRQGINGMSLGNYMDRDFIEQTQDLSGLNGTLGYYVYDSLGIDNFKLKPLTL